MKCSCGGTLSEPEMRIDPAATMRMLSFVEKLIVSTLPLLLRSTLVRLLEDLKQEPFRRDLRRKLRVGYFQMDVVPLVVREKLDALGESGEYHSGVPPPMVMFQHDDGEVTCYE
jgi:hypothetical protein